MATAAVTYTFTPGTTIVAAQANQNFTDIVNFLNTQAVHRDGSTAFTAVPSGPSVDPTTGDQLVRKAYIDAKLDGAWTSYTPTLTGITAGNGTLVGRYKLIGTKTCLVRVTFLWGSTSAGTGDFSFSLPFATQANGTHEFAGYALDNGTKHYQLIGHCYAGLQSVFLVCESGAASNVVGTSNPFAFGVNDQISFTGMYELA